MAGEAPASPDLPGHWCVPLGDLISLENCVARRTLPWQEVVQRGRKILALLLAWEARGISHGFLSPRAVWLGDEEVRLSDLGMHGFAGPSPIPEYWAPERGPDSVRPVTPAADVYALGAVLAYALVGYPPRPLSLGAGPDLSHLQLSAPDPIRLLLAKMLSPAPEDRPTLRAALLALSALEERQPGACPLPGHGRVRRGLRSPGRKSG
ncbi:MAG: hypothetical protein AABY80_00375, partial [Candidatus Deferrimicrobiota bacterium]